MAKKKKNKKNFLTKNIGAFLKNNELLLTALGAAASGAALVAAGKSAQRQKVMTEIADSVNGLFPKQVTPAGEITQKESKPSPAQAT